MTDDFETFRDPTLSMFQSLVDDVARRIAGAPEGVALTTRSIRQSKMSLRRTAADIAAREAGQSRSGPRPTTRGAGATGRFCAELALRYIKALATNDESERQSVSADYVGSTCDSAWVNTLKEYHAYFGAGAFRQVPYVRAATAGKAVIPMKPNAKVALVADWGTGAQPALDILGAIRDHQPDVLIHLGDIYYSGTEAECRENFLEPVNKTLRADRSCHVYTLSGNHDMYCGGVGYYGLLPRMNDGPFAQRASFFCLRSEDDNWQFLAMDTGLHDHSPYSVTDATTWIEDDELAWLCERLEEFDGQTILLSHHQLFSAFSPIGPESGGTRSAINPNLAKSFEALSAKGKIAAWFWGHEHSLTLYEPFANLKRGRCIGHGAIPVPQSEEIYKAVSGLSEVPKIVPGTELGKGGTVWNHGFAVLSFEDRTCDASYYQMSKKRQSLVKSERF